MLTFEKLLERAENSSLKLTSEQRADILNLNEFRGDLEHVKPRSWLLEVGGLPRMGAHVAGRSPRYFRHFHTNWNQKRLRRSRQRLRCLNSWGSNIQVLHRHHNGPSRLERTGSKKRFGVAGEW